MSYYPYLSYLFDKIIITDARPKKRAFFRPKFCHSKNNPYLCIVYTIYQMLNIFEHRFLTTRRAYRCKSGDFSILIDCVDGDSPFLIHYNYVYTIKSERYGRSSTGNVLSVYQINPLYNSVGVLSTSTGADGKNYEMYCLPFEYCLAWMLGINSANVKEEIREKLLDYQRACVEVLRRYFIGNIRKQAEINQLEIQSLERINELTESKNRINAHKTVPNPIRQIHYRPDDHAARRHQLRKTKQVPEF